ncbi:Pentatricopeptide repeat [Macleaya cordata]|uniref:Pentatricopeptide repeat n=1 Tax=Macleaya cordata TaxID=56857 RepID=A0A200QDU0_MACCD|nr:Pentatricopeptide repeat [Macleaya cordata]
MSIIRRSSSSSSSSSSYLPSSPIKFLNHRHHHQTSFPSFLSIETLFKKCKTLRNLQQIHARIIQKGLEQDNFLISQFVCLCNSFSNITYAFSVFNRVSQPNLCLWNSIIKGHCEKSSLSNTISIFNRMKQSDKVPDTYTFPPLIKSCSKGLALREGKILHAKSIIKSDHEWFFFSPSGRKYPNGSQARRATEVGFWKATGKERGIKSGSNVIGTKRTLVFHLGRAPKGERTEWIMHEYCIKRNKTDGCQDPFVVCRIRRKLDDSVKNDSQNGESGSNANSSNTNTDLCAGAQVGLDIQHSQTSESGKDKAMDCSSKNQMTGLDSLSTDKPDESEINHEPMA